MNTDKQFCLSAFISGQMSFSATGSTPRPTNPKNLRGTQRNQT
jgi:hypothetical protein